MRHPDENATTIELKRYLNELTRFFSCAYEVQILGDITCIRNEVETNSKSNNIEDHVPTRYRYWSIPTTTARNRFQPVLLESCTSLRGYTLRSSSNVFDCFEMI